MKVNSPNRGKNNAEIIMNVAAIWHFVDFTVAYCTSDLSELKLASKVRDN